MYSQRDEERFILEHAPAHGRLLDCGAWEATTFSNNLALVERGWEAVLVEPSPLPFWSLVEKHRHNQRVTLVNAFVGSQWRLRKFHVTADALSTADEKNFERWKSVGNFREILVPELPLSEVLARGPYDFINIDAEGASWDLLQQIDLDAMRCNLVCVEIDDRQSAIETYFRRFGFKTVALLADNLIAKRA